MQYFLTVIRKHLPVEQLSMSANVPLKVLVILETIPLYKESYTVSECDLVRASKDNCSKEISQI